MMFLVEAPLAFGAGLASVLSPCVLPVLPIIITGGDNDHRSRPLLIVLELTLTFILMGIASALFGSLIAGIMPQVERAAGLLIVFFGLLLVFDINPFKRLGFLSALNVSTGDVRPAARHDAGRHLDSLRRSGAFRYPGPGRRPRRHELRHRPADALRRWFRRASATCPHSARQRLRALQKHQLAVRLVSGGILMAFGIIIATSGMLAFSF